MNGNSQNLGFPCLPLLRTWLRIGLRIWLRFWLTVWLTIWLTILAWMAIAAAAISTQKRQRSKQRRLHKDKWMYEWKNGWMIEWIHPSIHPSIQLPPPFLYNRSNVLDRLIISMALHIQTSEGQKPKREKERETDMKCSDYTTQPLIITLISSTLLYIIN